MYINIFMKQVCENNASKYWLLKSGKFNFIPPWFSQRPFNDSSCYYCDAPSIKPILYMNNGNYPICQNCCAPAIDSVVPVETVPGLKLYNFTLAKGYLSSYPLFSKVAITSGIMTTFTTLCLSLRHGNAWMVSLIIGGLSTVGSAIAYASSRHYTPAPLPYDSIYAVLRSLERSPNLLEPIIPDIAQRYNLYHIVKLLTHIHENSHDPAILELQTIEAAYKLPLANAPMQEVLAFLERESTGILSATIQEIGQSISDNITLVLDEAKTKEELAVIFTTLSLAKKPINLTISAETSSVFSLADFTLPRSIQHLTLSHVSLKDLPDSFWHVTDSITLDNVKHLEFLPDLPAAGLPEQPLKLTILNSVLQALPRTITRRRIQTLDLTGCAHIKSLSANLATQIKDGTIQTLNLTGTNVWTTYQRNFVFNDEVRKLFGEYDPQKPHELFDHRSNLITSISPVASIFPFQHNRATSLVYTLILVLGITIPLGLLFMLFENYLWDKNHETVTDKLPFWLSYLTGSFLMSVAISHSNMSACTTPQPSSEKVIDFASGDTIFDVQALLMKQGRELLDHGVYDWDRLWIQIFEQPDAYSFEVPEPLIKFIAMFMDGLKGKFEGRLGANFKRFIQYRGGKVYLAVLSALPFHRLVQTIEQDCHRFPVILDVIQTMRSTIGDLTMQYHTVSLSLEQIIETDMPVPDPDPQIMRALFSLIASGYHINLSLDWSYDGKPQPFSFDMIPLKSNIDRLCINHAILNEVPEEIWWVRHEIQLDGILGLQELPALPCSVPQLPLKLALTNTTLDELPQTLGRRPLMKLNLNNSQFIRVLPQSIKAAIAENRVQEISLISTGLPCTAQRIYTGNEIRQLLNEDVFEAEVLPSSNENTQQHFVEDLASYVRDHHQEEKFCTKKYYCYLPNIEQTLNTVLTLGCIAVGGFALWQLKTNKDKEQDKCSKDSIITVEPCVNRNSEPENMVGFDFCKHSDFPNYARMLLGYVVQDVWLYEALQSFLESLVNMDTGQNWNCYELLYNISKKRLEFVTDSDCQQPRCRILIDSIVIRYPSGSLSNNMVSALNNQVINFLLKDEVILNLDLFETQTCLTDGTVVNLRKQAVVLMYALGYTVPGQSPESLYTSNRTACFVRRSC